MKMLRGNQQKVWMTIIISDKIDVKPKTVTRDKDGNYIIIKWQIQQEELSFINIYSANIKVPIYDANIDITERRNRL